MRTFPPGRSRRLLVAVPLGLVTCLTASCGTVSAADRPEPVAPAPRIVIATPVPAEVPPEPGPADPTVPVDDANPGIPPAAEEVDPALIATAVTSVEPNATVGAVVLDRTDGTTPLTLNGDRQFRSASLVKLLIAIDVLARGADDRDRQRLADMLRVSDDDIASSYWVAGGHQEIIARTADLIGLTGTHPPEAPGQWGEVLLTPDDVVRVYEYVMGLPDDDRELVVDALAAAPRTARDGFDQHFGIPGGLSADWAVKQGWGNNSSAMVLHSTGLVGPKWRYIVVLLTEHPLDTAWETAAQSVTAGAAELHGRLPEI